MPIIDTYSPLQAGADAASGYLNAQRQAKTDQSAINYQQGQDKQKQTNWQNEFDETKANDTVSRAKTVADTDQTRQNIKIAAATEEYNKHMRVWNLKNAALEYSFNKGKITQQQLDNEKAKLDNDKERFDNYLMHKYGEREAQQVIAKGDADIDYTHAATNESNARTSQIGVETQNEREGLGRGGAGSGTLQNVPPGWTKGQVAAYNLAAKQYSGQREYWTQLHPNGIYMGQGDDPMPNPPAPPKMDDYGPSGGGNAKKGGGGANTSATPGDTVTVDGQEYPLSQVVANFHAKPNNERLTMLMQLQRGTSPGISKPDQVKVLNAIRTKQQPVRQQSVPQLLRHDPVVQGVRTAGQGIGSFNSGQQF